MYKSKKMEWSIYGISLDKESKRCIEFENDNIHLNIEIIEGVNGSKLDKKTIISSGLATLDLIETDLLTAGALGSAESHRRIWKSIISDNKPALILEDDVITHREIIEFINGNYSFLNSIDSLFFTINTNSILQTISPQGLNKFSFFKPEHPSKEWIDIALKHTHLHQIVAEKFCKGFATAAYFVTPQGAAKLLENVFPLNTETVDIPFISDKMLPIRMDRSCNKFYEKMNVFITNPFLAYTPNTNSVTEKGKGEYNKLQETIK